MRRILNGVLLLASTALIATACSGGSKTGDKNVIAITVAPPNPSTAAGSTLAFTATAHLLDGEAKDVTKDPDTTWESSDTGVATVDAEGTASAGNNGGTTLITASRGDLHSPPQQLTVIGTPAPTPTPTPAPTANHVVISEVSYDSAFTEPAAEYIELHNPTASAVPIAGWKLSINGDTQSQPFTMPAAASIAANGYYTIAHTLSTAQSSYPTAVFDTGGLAFTLVNTGEWIELRNDVGTLIDQMAYGTGDTGGLKPPSWCATSAPSATAKPVSRKPVDSDGDTCDDWTGSAAPSPGAATP